MPAARYKVVQTELKTGKVVTALPLAGLSFTETLNSAGAATVGIPLNAKEADPESLSPGASGLVVLRDAVPVWGGILWSAQADLAANTLSLGVAGYHSHYSGRHFEHDVAWRTEEQAKILAAWFEMMNADGGIGTDASNLKDTGHKRTRVWTRYELKNVAEAIDELADNVGGFSFRYVPYWDGKKSRYGNRFLIAKRGGEEIPHILTHRVNCNITQVTYDSTALCTTAYSVGADNGNGERLVGIAENKELAKRIPKKSLVATYQDVKETQTLLAKSAATINAGLEPVAIPSLTLYPDMYSPADFVPGDWCIVEADSGYVALLDEFVVTERKTDIDTNGREVISLALANKELFGNVHAG